MPNLNILVDKSLLTAVNVAAAKAEKTQRDFVIAALAKASGWIVEEGDGEKAKGPREYPVGGDQGSTHSRSPAIIRGAPKDEGPDRREDAADSGTRLGIPISPQQAAMIEGAKCFCGSPVIWAKGADAGPLKWKCVQKGHYMTPRTEKP